METFRDLDDLPSNARIGERRQRLEAAIARIPCRSHEKAATSEAADNAEETTVAASEGASDDGCRHATGPVDRRCEEYTATAIVNKHDEVSDAEFDRLLSSARIEERYNELAAALDKIPRQACDMISTSTGPEAARDDEDLRSGSCSRIRRQGYETAPAADDFLVASSDSSGAMDDLMNSLPGLRRLIEDRWRRFDEAINSHRDTGETSSPTALQGAGVDKSLCLANCGRRHSQDCAAAPNVSKERDTTTRASEETPINEVNVSSAGLKTSSWRTASIVLTMMTVLWTLKMLHSQQATHPRRLALLYKAKLKLKEYLRL